MTPVPVPQVSESINAAVESGRMSLAEGIRQLTALLPLSTAQESAALQSKIGSWQFLIDTGYTVPTTGTSNALWVVGGLLLAYWMLRRR